ncbi:hypothetical protein NS183_07800 [Microbacterium testaceum]|nr:hypothetical protein NS183_07800 [Microbacterium testaceum]
MLSQDDADLFVRLVNVWNARRDTNLTRSVYYDGEAALQDFGISLPPQMRNVAAALGWVGKGVRAVTDRSRFEGVVSADGSLDPFDLDQVITDNQFRSEYAQAKVSSAVHGCSFLTVTLGEDGQPLIHPVGAEAGAGLWDTSRRTLSAFLAVAEVDENSLPITLIMYTPEKAVTIRRVANRPVVSSVVRNPLGFVTAVPLPYAPELRRPLGHSRISRAAMYYSDAALRAIVRAEVSSEFYSAPEYWLFGADVKAFVGSDKWTAVMGRIKAMDTDSNDSEDKPTLQRFTGASPQPHTDQLRMWANLFADDQDLEVKFADSSNPSSADAIFAAKESLITATKDANEVWDGYAARALRMAVMLRDGLTEMTDDLRRMTIRSTDPAIVSPSARADAFSKLASSIDGFGASEVGMEYAGLAREQIVRFQAERQRAQASNRINELVTAVRAVRGGDSGGGVPTGVGSPGVTDAGGASGSSGVA